AEVCAVLKVSERFRQSTRNLSPAHGSAGPAQGTFNERSKAMSDDTVRRMSPAELRETCYRAAGTAAVAYVLGFVYRDAIVNDDGPGWPTMSSEVEISDPT